MKRLATLALLALGCSQEGTGAPSGPDTSPALTTAPLRGPGTLPAGTGGQTSQATATALPGTGGQVAVVGTGGQTGTGGGMGALDAGSGVSVDATPYHPSVVGDALGNEFGIGTPCTETGTECTGALQCACKSWFGQPAPAGVPCLCTLVSFGSACSPCGNGAACCTYSIPLSTGSVTVSACFPNVYVCQ
jgi:hypothetical protein